MSRWTLGRPLAPSTRQPVRSRPAVWWRAHSERHFIWLAARRLGGYPELEWTFSINLLRLIKYYELPRGGQMVYEPLEHFDGAKEATELNGLLQAGKADPWLRVSVQIGMNTFESVFSAPGGKLDRPAPEEEFVGRHSVVTEYGGGAHDLMFWNSWGDWGSAGRGSLDRAYFDTHVDECWVWRSGEVGPPGALAAVRRARELETAVSAWTQDVQYQEAVAENQGRRVLFHRYRLQSLTTGGDVEVVDVRDQRGQRIGWLHMHHIDWDSPRRTVISELFVWPDLRRRGLGTLLWNDAVDISRERGY